MDDSFFMNSMRIAGVVALYWFVSISMVFLNKHLLSDVSLEAPMFVTWFQCVVAVGACYVLGALRDTAPVMKMFPVYEYDWAVAKQIMPLSIVFVGMITFNNLCLKHLGVAFYNVGRSLTTVFNVVLTFMILGDKTSGRALAMCAVIVAGFLVGVDQENSDSSISYLGVLYGIAASACVALNAIYIKKLMPLVGDDMWRMTAYNNTNALLLFLPVMIMMGEISEVAASSEIVSSSYWTLMTIAGLFGVMIGLVSMMQIRVTSPLTHNISGTSKACAQTILALQLTGEVKSFWWWMSNLMVLGGSMGYTMVRRAEMQAQHASKAQPVKVGA
eukprot:m.299031 g.299031  ORF g.299031 m.299031 type:complete len:330 (-) comp14021_c0_seq1:127-1116(-)